MYLLFTMCQTLLWALGVECHAQHKRFLYPEAHILPGQGA